MNAIANGFKIYTEFNDQFMTFFIKKLNDQTIPNKKIVSILQFKKELKDHIFQLEKYKISQLTNNSTSLK